MSPILGPRASASHRQRHQRCTPTGLHLVRLALLGFLRTSTQLCRPYTLQHSTLLDITGHYWTLLDTYCAGPAGRSFTSDSRRSAASSRSRSVRPDSWRVRRLRSLSLSPSCPACASRWPRACTARRGPCGSEARRGSTRACGGCRGGVEARARARRCRCKAGACGDRAGDQAGPQCLAAQASVRGQVGGAYLVLKVVLRHLLSVGWMSIMKLLSDSARRTAHSPRMSRST